MLATKKSCLNSNILTLDLDRDSQNDKKLDQKKENLDDFMANR